MSFFSKIRLSRAPRKEQPIAAEPGVAQWRIDLALRRGVAQAQKREKLRQRIEKAATERFNAAPASAAPDALPQPSEAGDLGMPLPPRAT